MHSQATSVEEYIGSVSDRFKDALILLRKTILNYLPDGFEEVLSYGMIGYVVPKSIYPKGYHCDSLQPLPFIHIAVQKNHISLYHMGIYANPELFAWFTSEYTKYTKMKPDMGKSCIRFKNVNQIPHVLIAELAKRITVAEWIKFYETTVIRNSVGNK